MKYWLKYGILEKIALVDLENDRVFNWIPAITKSRTMLYLHFKHGINQFLSNQYPKILFRAFIWDDFKAFWVGFFLFFFLDDWWFWASSKIILVACVPFMCTTEYLTHTKGLVLQKTLYCKRKEFGRLGKPALKRKTAVFHWKELMFFLKRVMLPKKNMNVSRRVWGCICIAQISYPSSLQAISHSILKEDPAMILLWLEAESTGITAFV